MQVPESPRLLDLPFDSWREGQREVVEKVVNSTADIILVVAPTGAGKSLIASAIPKVTGGRMIALTRYKSLQDQYERDFPHYVSLKGMRNYNCDLPGFQLIPADKAPCTAGYDCELRNSTCEYYGVVHAAQWADSVVTNYDYGMTTLKYQERPIIKTKDWIISDEAHFLDAQLTKAAEAELTKKHFDELSLRPSSDNRLVWAQWAKDNLETVEPLEREAFHALMELISNLEDEVLDSPKEIVNAKGRHKFLSDIVQCLGALASNDNVNNYVLTVTDESVKLRPLWPYHSELTEEFFEASNKTLLMSATLPPEAEIAELYGLEGSQIETIQMASTFPVDNRLVHVAPIANMNYANWYEEIKKAMKVVNSMLSSNRDEKVLIHVSSYAMQKRASELLDPIHKSRLLTHSSDNRESVLKEFERPIPYVLISPSAYTGLDVKDLRLQFLLKCLYPSLADNWVRERMKASSDWYQQTAIDSMVQAIGRCPRDEHTKARTIILDAGFVGLYNRNRDRFPDYIQESIRFMVE